MSLKNLEKLPVSPKYRFLAADNTGIYFTENKPKFNELGQIIGERLLLSSTNNLGSKSVRRTFFISLNDFKIIKITSKHVVCIYRNVEVSLTHADYNLLLTEHILARCLSKKHVFKDC
jgi:hypothetical protein